MSEPSEPNGPALTPSRPGEQSAYPDDLDDSRRAERRVLWKEAGALAVVAGVIVIRQLWLS